MNYERRNRVYIQHDKFATRAQTCNGTDLYDLPTYIHTGVYENKYYMITMVQICIRFYIAILKLKTETFFKNKKILNLNLKMFFFKKFCFLLIL